LKKMIPCLTGALKETLRMPGMVLMNDLPSTVTLPICTPGNFARSAPTIGPPTANISSACPAT
jgi:hypothetical protein